MAINFPDSPIANETHTDAGRTWKWDGTSWRLEGNASNYTHPDHTGDVTSNADGATTITDDVIEEKHINAGGTVGPDKVLVYDSNEATNWKWADQSGSGGGLQNVVEDTTPQLGGNLDVNGQDIVSTSNGDIDLDPNGTGNVVFKGNATKGSGQFKLNCENNSHGIIIKGPPHSAGASYTLTLPNDDGEVDQVLSTNGSGVLDWVDQTSSSGVGSLNQVLTVGNTSTLALTAGNITGDSLNLASSTLSISHAAGETFVNNANSDIKFQADKFSFDTAASGSSQIALIVDQNFIKPITIKDKDDSIGAAGEILSSTGSQVEWIAAPSGGASNLNDLGDVNAGSPSDGQVLKWQSSTSKWIAAADLTATGGSGGISLTDLSHVNATPAVSASLDYDSGTGVFTYTPAILSFTNLSQTPSSLGSAGYYLRVNNSQTALEWVAPPTFVGLADTDNSSMQAGKWLKVNTQGTSIVYTDEPALQDTTYSPFTGTTAGLVPSSSNSQTTKFLRSDGSWADPSGATYTLEAATQGASNVQLQLKKDGTTIDSVIIESSTNISFSGPPSAGGFKIDASLPSHTLDDHTDVLLNTSNLVDGQVLKWSSSSNKWINDTDESGSSVTPGGSSGQFQFNSSSTFAGSDLLLATSNTAFSGSGNSLTISGAGSSGGNFGNVVWEPSVSALSLTRDAFLIFGAADNSTASIKGSIGWSTTTNKLIINNPTTGGINIESRGDVTFKKQNSPNTVHMVIDDTNGVEIKNSLDLNSATIKDGNSQVGTAGQVLSSTGTGIDWITISTGGVTDGDKGDITVSNSGQTWNIDANTIGTTELSASGTANAQSVLRGDNVWSSFSNLNMNLDHLSDVQLNTSTLVQNHVLTYNGSKWVNQASQGGSDTNNYITGGSWSSSNGQLTLNRGGTSSLSNITISVSNLESYFDTKYSTTSGATTLHALTDTDLNLSNLQTNDLLQWNGSKWVNANVSLTDTNNYVTSGSWNSSTGQLTLTRGGTSSNGSVSVGVGNLVTYLNANLSSGISISGSPTTDSVIRYDGSNWQWSRALEVKGGTSSSQTNLVVHNNSSGYGGIEVQSNGELLLKKAGTSWREGGHLQFERDYGTTSSHPNTYSTPNQTFAIDVYNDTGSVTDSQIRVIDQTISTQRFAVNHYGAFGIGHTSPNFGQTGQVMISRGKYDPPYWGDHSSISGSAFASTAQGAAADTANSDIDDIYTQLNAIGNDASITTVAQIKAALAALVRG